jgi:hypothetical protein
VNRPDEAGQVLAYALPPTDGPLDAPPDEAEFDALRASASEALKPVLAASHRDHWDRHVEAYLDALLTVVGPARTRIG